MVREQQLNLITSLDVQNIISTSIKSIDGETKQRQGNTEYYSA